ncbi:MAG: ribonuclease P protein component [Rubripirellula sp.]|nr:ribonuclease P protein component [Rubripirellula sp.]
MTQIFPKHYRVLRGDDFTRILRRGNCAADGTLVLFAIASRSESSPRLGVTIPKKTGPAVVRNHWKRLIREAYRTQRKQLPPGFDFVVRPKKGAQPNGEAIRRSLIKLANRGAG